MIIGVSTKYNKYDERTKQIVMSGLECGSVRVYTRDRWYDIIELQWSIADRVKFYYSDRGIRLDVLDDIVYAKNDMGGEAELRWSEIREVYVKLSQ